MKHSLHLPKKLLTFGLVLTTATLLAACSPQGAKQQEETSNSGLFTGSFYELIARNVPQQCTWSSTTEQGETSGKTYVAGERLRSEAEVSVEEDSTITAYSIVDSTYIYSWTSQSNSGMKFQKPEPQADESTDSEVDEPVSNEELQDLEQEVTFNCQPWIVDEALFTPPANITFQDFSKQMEQLQQLPSSQTQGAGSQPFDTCQYCEQIPNENARQQCLNNC